MNALSLVTSALALRQMLSRLLNSSHPEDLKAANKLIKEMVQEVKLCPVAQSFHQRTLRKRIGCSLSGPEANREGDQEGERHPGSEGERGSADPAPAGLRQHRHQSEQRRARSGEAQGPEFPTTGRTAR